MCVYDLVYFAKELRVSFNQRSKCRHHSRLWSVSHAKGLKLFIQSQFSTFMLATYCSYIGAEENKILDTFLKLRV